MVSTESLFLYPSALNILTSQIRAPSLTQDNGNSANKKRNLLSFPLRHLIQFHSSANFNAHLLEDEIVAVWFDSLLIMLWLYLLICVSFIFI